MTRRDLIRLLLASAVAEAIDVEQLLWVPKPIIVVPRLHAPIPNLGMLVAKEWERVVRSMPDPFYTDILYDGLYQEFVRESEK